MRRLPLADQLPYRFFPPRIQPLWLWLAGHYMNHKLRTHQRVEGIDIAGTEHLTSLLGRGDGILITPNHADHADCAVAFELGRRIKKPFYFMAAYQIFTGIGRVGLPRIGVFPVDREGADLTAFKTGVEILGKGRNPLVVFPEGEIYFQSDRLTPLREGAAVLAATAVKKMADSGKTVWIVPAAIKYRFLDGHDPTPAFHDLMDELESHFTWRHRRDQALTDRIYRYAEGMLGLKELEYLGVSRPGSLKERLAHLRMSILDQVEDKRVGKRRDDPVPVRVKELRRVCLDALADPKTTPAQADELRRDLEDLFGVMQLFSYPGDYIRECPTLERVGEIMMKLEEDLLRVDMPSPRGPRRALLRLGPPIDVKAHLAAAGGRLRNAGVALTNELEGRIQGLLDDIGPGRPLPAPTWSAAPPRSELQSSSA
jgi:1-acyl-sn-glycerol-3-phosphate acyltransferase